MLNQNTNIYIYSGPGQVHLAYVVSVIDYNISFFGQRQGQIMQ
jgi:hypothetical protein